MLLAKLLNALTIYNLGTRYFKAQRVDVQAIRKFKSDFYEQMWKKAAAQTNLAIEPLGSGIFNITNGTSSLKVYQQYTQLGDSVTDRLIVNKHIIYKMLTEIDVPIPRYIHLKDFDISTAKSFMYQIGKPVVVKPAYGTGAGAGITTNVTKVHHLYQAFARSRAFCPETVIEEQIKGDNYRFLFFDGELLDCIVRHPPTVIGNGVSSLRRLIRQENKKRLKHGFQLAQDLIYMDLDTKFTLAAQGLKLGKTPSKGQVIKVKDVINANRAADNETPSIFPAEPLIEMCRKILDTLGVRLAGIDIITSDLTKDLRETTGGVIEINTPPGHFYHTLKKGNGYPVALRLLQNVFSKQLERDKYKTYVKPIQERLDENSRVKSSNQLEKIL
jgi:cyanophycin synthetase